MKGSSSIALRIQVTVVFGLAFIFGAVVIFGFTSLIGVAIQAMGMPLEWRAIFAAVGLIALSLIDLFAIKKKWYCPLGMHRQTPKSLIRKYPATTVAAVWGFDTGLAVTTFRVAAISWGALVMVSLGLSPWWIGFGYGIGFILPLIIIMWTLTPDTESEGQDAFVSWLERLLEKCSFVQLGSAMLLLIAGTVLLI